MRGKTDRRVFMEYKGIAWLAGCKQAENEVKGWRGEVYEEERVVRWSERRVDCEQGGLKEKRGTERGFDVEGEDGAKRCMGERHMKIIYEDTRTSGKGLYRRARKKGIQQGQTDRERQI